MIDMHSHILFGVDDGAKTLEESMELIREEVKKGVTHIIFTPHFNKRNYHLNQDKISANFQILKEYSEKENLNVQLYLGNEIYLDSIAYASIIDNGFYTLAGSKYVLVEFNELIPPVNIPEICYEINMSGYFPIMAHAERYEILYNNTKLLSEILDEGTHLQVNASSVIKNDNKARNKFTHYLLKNQLISFVASDVHNTVLRKFHLDEAYKAVTKIYGVEYADKIFKNNQLNIINNLYFDSPKFLSKKGILSKFFG
jgi:protein-tyrosine phosphatase